jgi:protein-L-isoaspartate(D-aspartate) O-methyltransferase
MTQCAMLKSDDCVLEIGTGSAYQSAVLAEIVEKNLYHREIVDSFASTAESKLKELGYNNVTVCHGDGYRGWQKKLPLTQLLSLQLLP